MMHGARPFRTTRRLQNFGDGRRLDWFSVKNQAGGPVLVHLYDEIGWFGSTAQDFAMALQQAPGDIEMHINSPGGDVFEGIAIFNQLRQRAGNVRIIVDGLAASAASFIAMAASPGMLEMAPHSELMIHDGFAAAIGNAADLRDLADQLDRVSDNIASIYAGRTGKPAAYWREKMRAETWYGDQQAVSEGLADKVHGQDSPKDSWDLSVFDRYRNAAPVHEPVSGQHSHEGPDGQDAREHSHDGDASHEDVWDPDEDGDDDSSAEGDTDHDYVLPDGRPGPKAKAARWLNADKYSAEDRKKMAADGRAMPDGSYPIADGEDLDNAIHAVGRGGADHDAIRRHVIKRAEALGLSSRIPDNWNADGSLSGGPGNFSPTEILAMFAGELASSGAGRE